ncbi:MAG TPA: serine/threonine protein kinase [Methylibium sp.]|nr:serine/threonine protein kinase [Methylibium sp.]
MPAAPPPFHDLTPHAVLDAMAAVGLHGDGRLLQLNSYENRVFQIALERGDTVVAKFYRAGRWSDAQILEEHAFALELAAAEVPVVAPLTLAAEPDDASVCCLGRPPTLAVCGSLRYAVAPRRAGRPPELDDPEVLAWIGRFIGRLHGVGRQASFATRRRLDVDTLGHASRDWLLAHGELPEPTAQRWADLSLRALQAVQQHFDAVPALGLQRLHGDCHPGNLLWTGDGPHFVDLDDCCTGPAVQDLWMLLPGDHESSRSALATLLEGYETFSDFDRRELALIEPLRTLRMIHHSAWLAQRWADPAFPAAFTWFGTAAYWSQQADQLQHQLHLLER